jgi:hypothetical protein
MDDKHNKTRKNTECINNFADSMINQTERKITGREREKEKKTKELR